MQKALIVEHGGFEAEILHVRRPTQDEINEGGWADWYKTLVHYGCPDAPKHKVESSEHCIYLQHLPTAVKVMQDSKSNGSCPGTNNSIYYLTDDEWDAILSEYNTLLDSKLAEIIKTEEEDQAKMDNAKAEASRTGQPVYIEGWMADCDRSVEDCSTDHISLYAMPDGTVNKTRTHTF